MTFWLFRRAVLVGAFALTACVQIPPEAAQVNREVSRGIDGLQAQGQQLVEAVRQTARIAVEEQFDSIFEKAEGLIRSRESIAAGTALSADQQKEVAALTHIIIEDAFKRIDSRAAELSVALRMNTAIVKGANDSITRLLESSSTLIERRQAVLGSVADLIPLPGLELLTKEGISDLVENTENTFLR